MAHFAKLDNNNIVTQIEVVKDEVILDENNIEQESLGVAFLRNLYNEPDAIWKKTSFNTCANVYYTPGGNFESSNIDPDQSKAFRGNYAKIDGHYDPVNDVFYDGQPHPSWILDTSTWIWEAPTPPGRKPQDGKAYIWNENNYNIDPTTAWVEKINN